MNWRKTLFNNIGWKLGSLFIAMMIWSSYYTGNREGLDIGAKLFRNLHTRDIIGRQVQLLSSQNIPKSVELSPKFVTISLKGERELIEPIKLADVLVYVDISSLPLGSTSTVPVEVKVPQNVVVDSILPTNVTVRLPLASNEP